MKFGLFLNPSKNQEQIVSLLKSEIANYGYEIDDENPDIVVFVGGDGTFLRAIHKYLDKLDSIKFVGISDGTLCFFFDYMFKDIPQLFKRLASEDYVSTPLPMLKAHLTYSDGQEDVYAVNEVRLENPFHTLIADVDINGSHLETFHGNGLIVCSSAGSSAYNKSIGGALVDPQLQVLQLTEIATIQNNVYRSLGSSLVVPGNSKISISGDFKKEVVGYDHLNSENKHPIALDITLSNKKVNIIHSTSHSWVKSLKRSFVK